MTWFRDLREAAQRRQDARLPMAVPVSQADIDTAADRTIVRRFSSAQGVPWDLPSAPAAMAIPAGYEKALERLKERERDEAIRFTIAEMRACRPDPDALVRTPEEDRAVVETVTASVLAGWRLTERGKRRVRDAVCRGLVEAGVLGP